MNQDFHLQQLMVTSLAHICTHHCYGFNSLDLQVAFHYTELSASHWARFHRKRRSSSLNAEEEQSFPKNSSPWVGSVLLSGSRPEMKQSSPQGQAAGGPWCHCAGATRGTECGDGCASTTGRACRSRGSRCLPYISGPLAVPGTYSYPGIPGLTSP